MSKVKYLNKTIPYTVNKAKIKNIYISIQNGEVVIKAPWYTTSNQIQEIVESKREWITKKLQEYQTSPRKTKDYADGETFQVLGEKYTLNIYYKDIANGRLNIADGHISIVLPLVLAEADNTERIKSMMDKMYFMIAQREVELAMEKTRKLTGLAPDEYNIKKLKIAFNYYGYPKELGSDNGSEFKNSKIESYLYEKNIKFIHGSPYNPHSQGVVERFHQTIKDILYSFLFRG